MDTPVTAARTGREGAKSGPDVVLLCPALQCSPTQPHESQSDTETQTGPRKRVCFQWGW